MAHIAVELMLDHLLIKHQLVNVARLYEHLENINRPILKGYLKTIGVEDIDGFMAFYDKFLEWRYIANYKDLNEISKPLINISKRVWTFDTPEGIHDKLTDVLVSYCDEEMRDFKDIYTYIHDNLMYLS
jgi:acyl carrier protein phosphodiesterase